MSNVIEMRPGIWRPMSQTDETLRRKIRELRAELTTAYPDQRLLRSQLARAAIDIEAWRAEYRRLIRKTGAATHMAAWRPDAI